LTAAGISIFKSDLFAAAAKKGELTGIQLYSIRTDMSQDPLGTLQKLSAMGYKHVEHANYINRKFYGWSATEFKKILSDLGMTMPSGHTVMSYGKHWDAAKKDFTDSWKYTVEDAATVGQMFVISPSMEQNTRKDINALKGFMDVFNKAGELCQKSGMKFGYHNHDFEFSEKLGNQTLYDIILTETDPKLVMQQLDIGNMINGGAKALDVMQKYPGRFESMHVKDEIKVPIGEMNDQHDSTILGNGLVDPKAVCLLAKSIGGTKHFIIEQESYQGIAPLECARINLERIKTWGLV
jgi:sugar phosphate isomerase/epimerase